MSVQDEAPSLGSIRYEWSNRAANRSQQLVSIVKASTFPAKQSELSTIVVNLKMYLFKAAHCSRMRTNVGSRKDPTFEWEPSLETSLDEIKVMKVL